MLHFCLHLKVPPCYSNHPEHCSLKEVHTHSPPCFLSPELRALCVLPCLLPSSLHCRISMQRLSSQSILFTSVLPASETVPGSCSVSTCSTNAALRATGSVRTAQTHSYSPVPTQQILMCHFHNFSVLFITVTVTFCEVSSIPSYFHPIFPYFRHSVFAISLTLNFLFF